MTMIHNLFIPSLWPNLLQPLALLFTLILVTVTSQAETSIWTISKDGNTHYIGGTFHLLKESDYPLPKEFNHVYKQVNQLVFETDVTQLDKPKFQQRFLRAMRLPPGKILADKLSPKAYAALIRYAAKNNIDTGRLQQLRPQMVSLIISVEELKNLGLNASGVDSYMANKAIQDSKTLHFLETIDQQIDYIASMSKNNESALILQTLKDLEKLPDDLDKMLNAWRYGDQQTLFEYGIEPMKQDYPDVYQSLLVERNEEWLPKIETLLQQENSVFILVGALHLVGGDGLLEMLKTKGYRINKN